jgi:hypothetical protein
MIIVLTGRPPDRLTAQGLLGVSSLSGSTRSTGLAGAGVALMGDAESIFLNPAGLATIHHTALAGSYVAYPGGTGVASAAAAVRVGRCDVGFGGQTVHLPVKTSETDVLGISTLVFRLGMIAVGTSLKYIREGAVPREEGWAGDVGVAMALFDIFALGASVQNLGGDLGGGGHVARLTRVGLTMNFVDPQGSARLLTTLEGQWPEGQPAVLVAGGEAGIVTRGGIGLIARMGVSGHSSLGDVSPLAFGAGVALGRVQVDYAYRSYDASSGAMHRFGLRWAR